jgi:hypothetical protein
MGSLTNFLLSIYIAKTLGAAQFGAFSLADRETIIRGTAGIITFTPDAVTVTFQQPAEPRIARALALLIDQVNVTPPQMPGDTPAHHLPAHREPGNLTPSRPRLPEIWDAAPLTT